MNYKASVVMALLGPILARFRVQVEKKKRRDAIGKLFHIF